MYTLDELKSAAEGRVLAGWTAAERNLAASRDAVDRFLADGGEAYGFSTFLGHLDRYSLSDNAQTGVLRAHLVGSPTTLPETWTRAITAVKLCQLAQNQSGISTESYAAVLDAFKNGNECQIDVHASYGSGDVVPASWWFSTLLPEYTDFRNGDVIALINGQFIAAGVLLAEHERIVGCLNDVIRSVHDVLMLLPDTSVQLPVSLRDTSPLEESVRAAISSLEQEIVNAANQASGNPLFTFSADNKQVREVRSNSSFLNFSLSKNLTELLETGCLASAYVCSAVRTYCAAKQEDGQAELHGAYFVQPPKVAKAYYDHILARTGSRPVLQNESKGIEDIGDQCLSKTIDVLSAFELLEKQLIILQAIRNRDDS